MVLPVFWLACFSVWLSRCFFPVTPGDVGGACLAICLILFFFFCASVFVAIILCCAWTRLSISLAIFRFPFVCSIVALLKLVRVVVFVPRLSASDSARLCRFSLQPCLPQLTMLLSNRVLRWRCLWERLVSIGVSLSPVVSCVASFAF